MRSRLAASPRGWALRVVRGVLIAVAIVVGVVASFAVIGPQFGYSYAVVRSGSMAPAYPPGSVILIGDAAPASLNAGDVISFRAPGQGSAEIITHRVVEVRNGAAGLEFVTKGDANEDPDSRAVPAVDVRGRVLLGVPWIGSLAALLQQRGLFFGVVLLCGLAIVGMELRNIVREVRRSRRRRAAEAWAQPSGRVSEAGPWVPSWAVDGRRAADRGGFALGGRWVRSTALGVLLAMVLFWTAPLVGAQLTDSESTTSNAIPMRTYATLIVELVSAEAGPFVVSISPDVPANPPETGCDVFTLTGSGSDSWACAFVIPGQPYTLLLADPGTQWTVTPVCDGGTVMPISDGVTVTLLGPGTVPPTPAPETVTCTLTITPSG